MYTTCAARETEGQVWGDRGLCEAVSKILLKSMNTSWVNETFKKVSALMGKVTC